MRRNSILYAMAAFLALAGASEASAGPTYRVGTEPTGIPLSFLDSSTGKLEGYMIDVVKELGKMNDFNVDVLPLEFSALIPALRTSKIDMISTGMYSTDARKKVISFTDPVYSYGEGMVVSANDKTDYKNFNEISGSTVGSILGTVYVEPLEKAKIFKEIKVYDTMAAMMKDVELGRIKAGFGDYPVAAYYLQKGEFPGLRLVKSYQPVLIGQIGIGLRQDDAPLIEKLNKSIAEMKKGGLIDTLQTKWGLK